MKYETADTVIRMRKELHMQINLMAYLYETTPDDLMKTIFQDWLRKNGKSLKEGIHPDFITWNLSPRKSLTPVIETINVNIPTKTYKCLLDASERFNIEVNSLLCDILADWINNHMTTF